MEVVSRIRDPANRKLQCLEDVLDERSITCGAERMAPSKMMVHKYGEEIWSRKNKHSKIEEKSNSLRRI